ncbi:MAG TPA: hypothetical protein VFN30_07840 [Chitinophagaceae bacterium]|nr:hypothetical protein [Chitinophagaceae bacterium]
MKLKLITAIIISGLTLFSCKKELSYEKGNEVPPTECTPDYKGGCNLISATYNTFDPNNPSITYNFTYVGNMIAKITSDYGFNINISYNSDKLISRLDYEDDASGEIFYYEELFYNSQKKPDSLRSWMLGVNGYEYNSRYEFFYSGNGLLSKKVFWLNDETQGELVKQETYSFQYDNNQVTLITDTLNTENPPITIPYSINPSSVCNPFQIVYPQIELFDFYGDDFNSGYTVLFNSQKVPASINGLSVLYTYNNKNAPTSIMINGDLLATYVYDCP